MSILHYSSVKIYRKIRTIYNLFHSVGVKLRSPTGSRKGEQMLKEQKKVGEKSNTFVVKVLQDQNKTWQGSITWTEGEQTQCFRSALEMLNLMNNAVISAGEQIEEA